MSNLPANKSLSFYAGIAALFAVGQGAFAHTTVMSQATEGTTAYNALQIGHGCTIETGKVDANKQPITKKIPVVGQSAIFPTLNPLVTRPDPADPAKTIAMNLADVISDPLGLAGKADLVQDRSVFKHQDEITDNGREDGKVIGFHSIRGDLQTNLRGLVPFRFTPPVFTKSDGNPEHCANSILIKVAIADICKKNAFPPKEGTANLWIPSVTSKFTDGNIDGIGAAATLTVKRNTAKNPLDPSCGDGYAVTISPSNEDVDAHLPVRGYWN
jgi:hypothetical protein